MITVVRTLYRLFAAWLALASDTWAALLADAQQAGPVPLPTQSTDLADPHVHFEDVLALPADYAGDPVAVQVLFDGRARPLSPAAGDLDGDGTPDLLARYGAGGGGILAVHRGNVDAIYPHAPDVCWRRGRWSATWGRWR